MRDAIPLRQTKTGGTSGLLPTFSPRVNKTLLRDAILRQLHDELALQTRAAELARDEAISEESRPENKWDTHSQEAAYLAEGQAKLASEVKASIDVYTTLPLPAFAVGEAIALGAVAEIEAGSGRTHYFVGPRAGGMELNVEGRRILVLTPQSPLGRQLIGKRVGDVIEAPGRGTAAAQRIVAVE